MPFHFSLRLVAAGICLLLAGTISAADKKPLLTEKEIADGWILLFDGETTFGWTGEADVKDGALRLAKGTTLSLNVHLPAGELALDAAFVTATHAGGKVQLTSDTGGLVRGLKFHPAKTEKLLNGKDLTGWKVFKDEKRAKSEWSVTAAGELALKNGPGDLQSEKQFDDFVLQLECKTNGAALNSGVFFRCIADQYQNGYEMQIQNAYKENDRTKPADFGTGAIYRRTAARKVVANDKEWFAMTLVAHGPHIATWVNGYPVVSWKDERAPNDNPRQGLKTGKGHLSIQGHDPTTDLLFRNVRVAEVK